MPNEHPPDASQPSELPPLLEVPYVGGTIPTKRDDLLKQAGVKEEKYDPQKGHDEVRAHITYILLSILGGTLAFIFAIFTLSLFFGNATMTWTSLKDMLQVLLPAETALIGSAVGFYFGSQVRSESDRSQRP